MKLLQNFHVKFLLFSLLLVGLILLLQQYFPQIIAKSIWTVFFFILILSYLMSVLANWLYKQAPENFLQIKLLGMVIRIIASLGFITWVVLSGEKNILLFISNYFILFLFYLVFDIYSFISNLRPISK